MAEDCDEKGFEKLVLAMVVGGAGFLVLFVSVLGQISMMPEDESGEEQPQSLQHICTEERD